MRHWFTGILLFFALFVLAACGHPVEGGLVLRSADPGLSLFVPVPPAAPQPAVVPAEEVGEAEPEPPLAPPCEQIVKGNISRSGEKIAHAPGDPNYAQVKIDEAAGEQWFCSMADAEAAGWRAVRN